MSVKMEKKGSTIYVWKGSKYTSAAVSISYIVIKKNLKISRTNTSLFKDFSGIHFMWNISLIPYNSHKNKPSWKYIHLLKTSLD